MNGSIVRQIPQGVRNSDALRFARHVGRDARYFLSRREYLEFFRHVATDADRFVKRPTCGGNLRDRQVRDAYREGIRTLYELDSFSFVTAVGLFEEMNRNTINVFLRHDVDYSPEDLSFFTEFEQELGIRSSIYVMTDGKNYELDPYAEQLTRLQSLGFHVGLHSEAYCASNYENQFIREFDTFRETLGFEPDTYSIHGVSQKTEEYVSHLEALGIDPASVCFRTDEIMDRRYRLYDRLPELETRLGLLGRVRGGFFDVTIQDSTTGENTLTMDRNMLDIERVGYYGAAVQVLTHPRGWVAS